MKKWPLCRYYHGLHGVGWGEGALSRKSWTCSFDALSFVVQMSLAFCTDLVPRLLFPFVQSLGCTFPLLAGLMMQQCCC